MVVCFLCTEVGRAAEAWAFLSRFLPQLLFLISGTSWPAGIQGQVYTHILRWGLRILLLLVLLYSISALGLGRCPRAISEEWVLNLQWHSSSCNSTSPPNTANICSSNQQGRYYLIIISLVESAADVLRGTDLLTSQNRCNSVVKNGQWAELNCIRVRVRWK